jgi:hypothetical protein
VLAMWCPLDGKSSMSVRSTRCSPCIDHSIKAKTEASQSPIPVASNTARGEKNKC